jgi:Flp pilus assembly protein TadD
MRARLPSIRAYVLIAGLAAVYILLSIQLEAAGAQREYPEASKPKPASTAPKPKAPPAKKPPPKKPTSRPKTPAGAAGLSPDKYVEQGDSLASEGKWEEAEAAYLKAVRLEPNNVRWRVSLAIALTRQKKYPAAEAEYREAARIEPNNAQWRAGIGDRLAEQQKYAQAETAYREAVRLEPDNVFWRTYLGFVLARQKKYSEAEAEYRRAAELDPNNATRHAAVGDRLVEQSKYSEAEAEYRRAVRLEPNNARWRDYLGYVLIKQQKWSEAEAEYKEAVRLDPSEPRFQELLKELSSKASEKPAPAKATTQPTAKTEPPADAPARKYIVDGDRLVKEKKWAEAEAAYKQAAQYDKKNAVLHTKLAIALSAQQKDAEAEAAHREAARLEPARALWRFNLGVVLSRQGKLVEAEGELKEAVRLDPKNVQYQATWKQVTNSMQVKSSEDAGAQSGQAASGAGTPADPSGVWSIEVRTAQGNVIAGFKLRYEAGQLTGTFIGPQGTTPIKRAAVTGNQLRFTANIKIGNDMLEATLTGTIRERLIRGVLQIPPRTSFEFTGSKAK